MEAGTYTSKERVERGGVLIAFAGEVMTMEEAELRGLTREEPEKPAKKNKADLVKEAEELGIELPEKATVEVIKGLIADFKEKGGDADGKHDDQGSDGNDADGKGASE